MMAGRMPSFTSVNPNTRVIGGNDDVADGGQARAAAEGRAMDEADKGLRQGVEGLEHVGHRARVAPVLVFGVARHALHPRDVGPGGEGLAAPREHDRAHRRVGGVARAQVVNSAIIVSLNALRTSGRLSVTRSTRGRRGGSRQVAGQPSPLTS